MRGKRRVIGMVCLLLAAFMIVPSIPATGNLVTVQAAQKNGLVKEKGNYRCYRNGKLQKKAWKTIKGKKYYFQKNGNAAVGSCKIGGKYYIFNAKGQLVTPSKKVKTKVVTVKGVKYQAKAKGLAAKGWSKDKKYYFGKDGRMFTGIRVIGEKFYSFGNTGKYNETKTKQLRKAAKYEKDMTDLYKLIGQPKKSQYLDGCYKPDWDPKQGKDGILTYKNFTVYTYKGTTGKEIYMGVE